MFDFSNVAQGNNTNAELAQIPEGTMFVASLHLADKTYSDLTPPYLVKNSYEGGLIYFHYDLVVKSPAQHAGRTFGGKKAVTLQGQIERQVNMALVKDGPKKCTAGDRAVAAILAFDAMARGVPRNMAINTYDDLEGRYCALQVARSPQGSKYLQFLSPLFAKEQMTCEMLAEKFRQETAAAAQREAAGMPVPMPVPNAFGYPNPYPQQDAPAQPQQYAPQQPVTPPPARVVQTYPQQAQPQLPYPQQQPPANNGWPTPQGQEDDIPF